MERFKVAAVQMNALKDDLDHNLDVHVRFIRRAAEEGCRLVLFPELSATAHYGDTQAVQFAEEAGRGRVHEVVSREAKAAGVYVSYGFCEVAHGTYFNSQMLVGPDGVVGLQRKVHASNNEYFVFRMGRSFEVFDLGFCRIGTLICYDTSFFESWRVLALKGAEVILTPHASRTGWGEEIPRDRQLEQLAERRKAWPGALGVYARDNAVFAVHSNQVDYNGHSTHGGGAYVIDPGGEMIASAEASLEDLCIVAELDPKALDGARGSPGCTLKTRRPEVYGDLTRMI